MRALVLAFALSGCATVEHENLRERAANLEREVVQQQSFTAGCHDDNMVLQRALFEMADEIAAWQRGAEAQARYIQKLLSREDI